jgi:hypothetical protein
VNKRIVTYDRDSNTFTIDADFLVSVNDELVGNGVQGHDKYPYFGKLLLEAALAIVDDERLSK